ncbi:hypothetical protein ACFR97_12100 [Haloplanus litoreus]|uniref:AIPR protein n=3 Tax=Haloplanus litoreus TaxID=767515 RepID=A0ABD5ZYU9_9EURY
MRDRKDNIFYFESGTDANPLEKNTVHGFIKTLSDTENILTDDLFALCTGQNNRAVESYDYRTELSADDASPTDGEERILIGLSRTGGVRDGGGTGDTSQIDSRIRAKNSAGEPIRSLFIEAKAAKADLRRRQLEDYAEAFDITARSTESPWKTIQWADIYRIFEDARAEVPDTEIPSRDDYLLEEINRRLLQKGMVRGTLGVSRTGGEDGNKYRKRLLVGPREPDSDPVLTFWAFSRRDDRPDQSSSMEVPQETFRDLFGDLDLQTRRAVFLDGELATLREWTVENTDVSESDYESDTGRAFVRAEREGYDDPAGVMLRFSNDDLFKINSYNVNSSRGWVRHPPILAEHEWRNVFQQMTEKLSDEQQRRFVEDFDFGALWDAYLKRSG